MPRRHKVAKSFKLCDFFLFKHKEYIYARSQSFITQSYHFDERDSSDSEQAKQILARNSTKNGLLLRSYLRRFLLRRNDKNEVTSQKNPFKILFSKGLLCNCFLCLNLNSFYNFIQRNW